MTRPQNNGRPQSGFSDWSRRCQELDSRQCGICSVDIDFIWYRFRESNDIMGKRFVRNMMVIEEKRFGTDLTYAQRDTLYIFLQLFPPGRTQYCKTVTGRPFLVKYWGLYKLSYDGACPATSKTLWWNKREVDEQTLIRILLFDLRPDNPARHNDKRINHHAQCERDEGHGYLL